MAPLLLCLYSALPGPIPQMHEIASTGADLSCGDKTFQLITAYNVFAESKSIHKM